MRSSRTRGPEASEHGAYGGSLDFLLEGVGLQRESRLVKGRAIFRQADDRGGVYHFQSLGPSNEVLRTFLGRAYGTSELTGSSEQGGTCGFSPKGEESQGETRGLPPGGEEIAPEEGRSRAGPAFRTSEASQEQTSREPTSRGQASWMSWPGRLGCSRRRSRADSRPPESGQVAESRASESEGPAGGECYSSAQGDPGQSPELGTRAQTLAGPEPQGEDVGTRTQVGRPRTTREDGLFTSSSLERRPEGFPTPGGRGDREGPPARRALGVE